MINPLKMKYTQRKTKIMTYAFEPNTEFRKTMIIRIKTIAFILILILIANKGFSQNGIISGYVFDKVSKEPVIGANIIMFETNYMTVSDTSGFFEIKNLVSGKYSFGIKLTGYKDTTINNIVVEPGNDLNLKFFLSECEYHILGHPETCPICGMIDEVVPILYGVATKKMIKKERKGVALIGGERTGCDPVYYCKKDKVKF